MVVNMESDVFQLNGEQVVARYGSHPDGSFMFDFGREEVVNDWGFTEDPALAFGNCGRVIQRYDGEFMNRFECSYVEGSPPDGILITLDSHGLQDSSGVEVTEVLGRVVNQFRSPSIEALRMSLPWGVELPTEGSVLDEDEWSDVLAAYCDGLLASVSLAPSQEERFFCALHGMCCLAGWTAGSVIEPSGPFDGMAPLKFPAWWPT